ncbi:MAG: bifunctional 23S rRNA (guanine(2069)-N(7))-methyltransferase RlmK/23S rRNA (guanine(2445)-N(2))-methyltransferase RlmL [Coriobacteriia bacterium]|nr:bifunctional 23S rRNA (guanine(2069)-N(7))-methyltransferase RlmK/23S rRNA (guanine(2445)-N(2))-methyltransferase RlmL [Coriobacteriia bacterium]
MGFEFYATCAKGAEKILAFELATLGIRKTRPLTAGVSFNGELADAYRALLWLRTASRVLLVLARVDASNSDALYAGVRAIPWEEHVLPTGSIAVDARGTNAALNDTRFVGMRVKDAVCDRLRELTGERPSVDRERPDLRINVSLRGERATIALDLAGEPLHRRGYRVEDRAIKAPLRETLAATMLLAADITKGTVPFVIIDPLCGSGTLVIEAARMMADIAPGILRSYWGFDGWLGHDTELWATLIDEADARAEAAAVAVAAGGASAPRVFGSDIDPAAIKVARASAAKAGVAHLINFSVADVALLTLKQGDKDIKGTVLFSPFQGQNRTVPFMSERLLIVCNPPYGERLSTESQLPALYAALGSLKRRAEAQGFTTDFCVITPHAELDGALGCQPDNVIDTFNGPLETTIRYYRGARDGSNASLSAVSTCHPGLDLGPTLAVAEYQRLSSMDAVGQEESMTKGTVPFVKAADLTKGTVPFVIKPGVTKEEMSDGLLQQYPEAEQFVARLRKMAAHRSKWARRAGVSCYRVYDADLPDYAVAIDLYQGAGREAGTRWLQIAEYAPPKWVDPDLAARRLNEALVLAPAILEVPTTNVFSKQRKRDKGGSQYAKDPSSSSSRHVVEENGLLFEVDFSSRLDTGLFLDHRLTRQMLRERAEGQDVLNLFAYTGSASVYMAAGRARGVTTVDLSQTYLAWAKRNMERNGFKGAAYQYIDTDAVRWVQEQRRARQGSGQQRYGLIFVDPPTFSNSTQMGQQTWDVQRDHAELLIAVSRILTSSGVAVFSTNLRSFKPDVETLARARVRLTDISAQTIPPDFDRNPRIHRCYLVERIKFDDRPSSNPA